MTENRNEQISKYIEKLNSGEVCLHPAGTLYGLTCDPYNKAAVKKIFDIKNRPAQKSFLYLSSSLEKACSIWQKLPESWEKVLDQVWPDHITVVWNIRSELLDKIINTDGTVGIRVPLYSNDSWYSEVLTQFQSPLPTTSINYSGQESKVDASDIIDFCKDHGVYIMSEDEVRISSPDSLGKPSTIIKIEDDKSFSVLRKGAYEISRLLDLGMKIK
jgi:L-threonylcarbamoyladenylate synthase